MMNGSLNTAGPDADLLTVQEAAREIGCTQAALYQAVKQERLPHVRVLGRIGLRRAELSAFAARFGLANGWRTRREHRQS